ncbi:serine hydrolase domain-containing protein [Nonomuraea sp. NPDC050556]|uniref:serine hydrolase domain-containing protein n=1 Tax=Nonomuraea sp. NPDC050556 TaxID=3364369 RepID=UPI0037B53D71
MTSHKIALDWVRREVDSGRLPCAVFGAATSSGIEVLEAYGTHDGRATRVDDHFALFSVTKPIVGLAAMRQVERGLMSLRRPLAEVLPGFARKDVTLWHLLTHTSGIFEQTLNPDDLVEHLVTAPSLFEAGTLSHYSNLAFTGIAEMVRDVTGRDVASVIDDELNPLGGLTFDPDCSPAEVHGLDLFGPGFDFPAFIRLRHPAGALFSRAEDLLELGSALLRGSVVHPVTHAAMTTPQTTGLVKLQPDPVNAGQDWGLPWNLRHSAPGLLERRLYGHGGASGCQWWMYPDHDACFVLLINVVAPSLRGVDIDNLHNAFTTGLPTTPFSAAAPDALASGVAPSAAFGSGA